ncbi:MAG: hypothetical protein IPK26_13270 [Planctomycetes bacterium]|nr:hypothetical protein [Planctomycetota bacterium]
MTLPGCLQMTLAQLDRDAELELLLARGSAVAMFDRLQMQGLVIGSRGELALANHLVVDVD